MSVEWARARCRCDECYAWFEVDIDLADEVIPGWSLHDIVEDVVRGGVDVVNSQHGSTRHTSVLGKGEEAKMLCAVCTVVQNAKEGT